VTFNLACLEDECGNKQLGAALFGKLRRDAPLDVDVLLRHALTHLSRGAISTAEALATEADTAVASKHPDAVALLGGLAIARRDYKAAQALLDSFRKGTGATGSQLAMHAFALDEHIMVCAANALFADALRDADVRTGRIDGRLDAEASARRASRTRRSGECAERAPTEPGGAVERALHLAYCCYTPTLALDRPLGFLKPRRDSELCRMACGVSESRLSEAGSDGFGRSRVALEQRTAVPDRGRAACAQAVA
jgi:hypothetical protein